MRTLSILAAAALSVTATASAQFSPFSLELTPGGSYAVQEFGNLEGGPGLSSSNHIRYQFLPHLSAYAGWEWHRFFLDREAEEMDVEQTGYALGLRYEHPLSGEADRDASAPAWWVRAGATLAHFEVEDESGESVDGTDHGLGWEAGAGISWPLSRRFAIAPGLSFRMLRREIDLGLGPQDATLSFATLGVGIVIRF